MVSDKWNQKYVSRGNSKNWKLSAETKWSHIVSRSAKGERNKCEHKCNRTLIIAMLSCKAFFKIRLKIQGTGTSLVVQRLKTLCFHCRGHRFGPWSGKEDPTCRVVWLKKKKNTGNNNIINHEESKWRKSSVLSRKKLILINFKLW